jgi:hypothetical protein
VVEDLPFDNDDAVVVVAVDDEPYITGSGEEMDHAYIDTMFDC